MPESAHAALKPVLESGRLATGPQVGAFESQLAEWLGHPQVAALSDASAALTLALYQAGVRPGDEVITSPLACSATLMPIANLFAHPVWCDIDPLTGMIDACKIDSLVSGKTRAILICHWSGDVADMDAIAAVAKKYDLKLIEDASEAFGAEYKNKRLGGVADFTVYSFYATKHINCGEGAALLAKNKNDAKVLHRLRRFGIDYALLRLPNGSLNPHFDIPVAGFNFPMNEIAATLGIEGFCHADRIVAQHRANGNFYEATLADIPGVRLLKRCKDSVSGYWTYALLAERRDDLMNKLISRSIGTQRLHLRNDAYSCFGGMRQNLPGVDEFDALNISIPCGWWVSAEDRDQVVKCIREGW